MPQARYTILLVDDRPEDRETYRSYLLQDEQHDYKFLEVDSGEGAIALCLEQFPDAIALSDLLPDMDGLEVLRELKTSRDTDTLPVVMLAEQGNVGVAVAAIKEGASDYLIQSKMDGETLRLAIKSAIERDRKRMEEQLQAANNELEKAALIDITSDAIIVRDLNSQILFWNRGAERIFGWTASEAIGKNAIELLYKNISPQLESALKTVVEQGFWQGELNKIAKSGQELIVECRWTLMRDETGQPKSILAVDTDITDKKQLEAQLLRAQRLESFGNLASGISHDLNNILTPILAAVQLLPIRLPNLDERTRELLEVAEINVKRAAALLKQLLSFARGVDGNYSVLSVEPLVAEIKQMAKEIFPKSIDFYTHVQPNLWSVEGDPTQLHQVLVNLCLNARDAMPEGGRLRLSAKNLFINENFVRLNLDAQVGNYVVITVSDMGCGIDPAIINRIFDPFFTTKEMGKGTGLGLSVVASIVKNHGGFIDVHSEVGVGTQFKVFLPAVEAKEVLPQSNGKVPRGNGELILIVDDEAAICETTKTTLETYGYHVLMACDGVEAVAKYAQHQQEIGAVLMDIMMPSMDGAMATRAIQQINPSVKIIAVSGLISNEQITNDMGAIVQTFLPKPYTAELLLKTLYRVLRELLSPTQSLKLEGD